MVEWNGEVHSPIERLVQELDGGPWFTVSMVARRIGRSPDTVRRWLRDPRVPVPKRKYAVELGPTGMRIAIFSESDVRAFERYAKHIRPGRKVQRSSVSSA